MGEPLVEMVSGRPPPQLRALVAEYTGYRVEGAEPGVHRGLPSRHVTFIVTLDGTVDLLARPGTTDRPASFSALVGGLHTTPALIRHDGHQHGAQLHLPRRLIRMPARCPADDDSGPPGSDAIRRNAFARRRGDRSVPARRAPARPPAE